MSDKYNIPGNQAAAAYNGGIKGYMGSQAQRYQTAFNQRQVMMMNLVNCMRCGVKMNANRSLIPMLFTVTLIAAGTTQTTPGPASKPLSAPTYYIAIRARTCEPEAIRFDGASNLPQRAMIGLKVSEDYEDAWKDYSDFVNVPVAANGFFEGEIPPKKGTKFHRNLLLIADFTTYEPQQPKDVLDIVGKKGRKLGGLENPQAHQLSGEYYILQTIDRVPSCGEGVTRPAN